MCRDFFVHEQHQFWEVLWSLSGVWRPNLETSISSDLLIRLQEWLSDKSRKIHGAKSNPSKFPWNIWKVPNSPILGLISWFHFGGLLFARTALFWGDESWSQKKKEAFFALVPSWTPQKVVLLFDSPGTMEFELRIVATIPWMNIRITVTNQLIFGGKNWCWKIFSGYVSNLSMHLSDKYMYLSMFRCICLCLYVSYN